MRLLRYFPWYPILPTQYTNALSYYEEIRYLQDRINELIKTLDKFMEDANQEAKDYTDEQISQLRQDVENALNGYSATWANEIAGIKEDYLNLNIEFNKLLNTFNQMQPYLDMRLEQMRQDLEQYIREFIGEFPDFNVVNPITGEVEPINTVLMQIYNATCWGKLTAEQYDRMWLTAEQYDSCNLTAWQYDVYARHYLFPWLYLRMLSPFTGQRDFQSHVIIGLYQLHRPGGLTAQEYADLKLTAQDYDSKDITAILYATEGKQLLS